MLRHDPSSIGLELDSAGWTNVDSLLKLASAHGTAITLEELIEVVRRSDKKRFSLSDDNLSIRANQGHSISVSLGYSASIPPQFLLHGTAQRFKDAILKEGLKKMNRHHVHMTESIETARSVGTRYGKLLLLRIRSQEMHELGYKFYCSDNNVWLSDHVPAQFIDLIELS